MIKWTALLFAAALAQNVFAVTQVIVCGKGLSEHTITIHDPMNTRFAGNDCSESASASCRKLRKMVTIDEGGFEWKILAFDGAANGGTHFFARTSENMSLDIVIPETAFGHSGSFRVTGTECVQDCGAYNEACHSTIK